MSISEIFIRRPIATTLVMIAIFVFGVLAYRLLPVSDLPSVDCPTINIQAGLPGANPDTMVASVALPIEKALSNSVSPLMRRLGSPLHCFAEATLSPQLAYIVVVSPMRKA